MAIIKCPECAADISDGAIDCPRCGRPLVRIGIRRAQQAWKTVAIVGGLAATFGVAAIWLDVASLNITTFVGDLRGMPSWLFFGGLAVNTLGRVGAWWTQV